ncbi:MAG: PRC-barrel domain-containing protein [Actinomycetota bacterium]
MADEDRPIAWPALKEGTPVHDSSGTEIGKVGRVVADQQQDIFSGITVTSGIFSTERFAPADLVGRITESSVELNVGADGAEQLEPY